MASQALGSLFLVMTLTSSIMTALELLFLYRDSLSTAARMAKILDIPREELEQVDLENSISHWLIHAALGAPGFHGTMFGIDPVGKNRLRLGCSFARL